MNKLAEMHKKLLARADASKSKPRVSTSTPKAVLHPLAKVTYDRLKQK